MKAGILTLVLAYVLSQFYRAFLAVLTPVLKTDLGASAEDLAVASGLWFLTFAAMQIPIGVALDRVGPRLTAALVFGFGGAGGALVFAAAQNALGIKIAMALIGIGCSPVLMANYYIFARQFSPALFGTLAGVVIGIGSLGNIASSLPLAWAVASIGWRETLIVLGLVSLALAVAILIWVRDPDRLISAQQGSLFDLLRMPAIWLILPMMAAAYMPAAALRGLWVGPYYADVFGADAAGIGHVTLAMSLAMVVGNLIYGPLDRVLGTRKWLVVGGSLLGLSCLAGLWIWPVAGGWASVALLSGVGLFGSSYAVIMAHGRAFFPAHLLGRGVTLFNLFSIGAVSVAQFATGRIFAAVPATTPEAPYVAIFGFFALVTILGLLPYVFSQDRMD